MKSPHSKIISPARRWEFIPAVKHSCWIRNWDELNRRSHRSPLLQSWFLLPALKYFGNGRETVAVQKGNDDQIRAMILLSPFNGLRCNLFKPSQVPISTILLTPGEDLLETIRSLLKALPPQILAINLMHCDERLISMPKNESDMEITLHMETGSTFIGKNFSDYYSTIPARARQNLERRTRKAENEVGTVSLQVWHRTDQIDEFVKLYSRTEMKGWKGKAGTAIRFDGAQGNFYRDILKILAEQEKLRMFVLMFGNTPVAQQIAIDFEGITYFLKTTFDEDFRVYSPGSIQRHRILEWSHNQIPSTRDFEIYGEIKQSTAPFITSRRRIYHLTVFRSAVVPKVLVLYRWLKKAGRSHRNDSTS